MNQASPARVPYEQQAASEESMTLELIAITAAGVGMMAGLWWALADFILDRVGSAPTEWGEQRRGAHAPPPWR